MLKPHEALEKIFEAIKPLGSHNVDLSSAVDQVLAEDVVAQLDLPPFDTSAMDGFAVLSSDVIGASEDRPVQLRVLEKVRAGLMPNKTIKNGEAVMIMTGAPLPQGATAVVMKEAARYDGKDAVQIFYPSTPGDNIRSAGEDVRNGEVLLKKGTRIRPYEAALLAAQGRAEASVFRRPAVGVLATGDELADAGTNLSPGQIYNSNGPALLGCLKRWNVDALDLGIVKDETDALKAKLNQAFERCDMLLVSGGVSVGEFDFTKTALESCGVKEVFWKVAIKPGKPLYFGVRGEHQYVFGLPGNPISALVCLEEFVRPTLEKLRGFTPKHPSYHLKGRALNDYPLPAGRRQYLFSEVILNDTEFELKIIRPQGSAMMFMASKATALALPAEGARRVKEGDILSFRWLK